MDKVWTGGMDFNTFEYGHPEYQKLNKILETPLKYIVKEFYNNIFIENKHGRSMDERSIRQLCATFICVIWKPITVP